MVACPSCGEDHAMATFEDAGKCPSCGRGVGELKAISRGGVA